MKRVKNKNTISEIVFRVPEFLTVGGRVFHKRGAEQENEPSYSVVCDLGTNNEPFSDDRKFRAWASDIGFKRLEIYSGV